jgi:hypothetical protein
MIIEESAVIKKYSIPEVAKLKGKTNDATYPIEGGKPKETLCFLGFVGRLDRATKNYVGVYRFETNVPNDCQPCSFAPLIEGNLATSHRKVISSNPVAPKEVKTNV